MKGKRYGILRKNQESNKIGGRRTKEVWTARDLFHQIDRGSYPETNNVIRRDKINTVSDILYSLLASGMWYKSIGGVSIGFTTVATLGAIAVVE